MKTCIKCKKVLGATNVTGLCRDCFLKAHPEVKPKTFKNEIAKVISNAGKGITEGLKQMEKGMGNIEINPSLQKKQTSYDTYREIKKEELDKLRGNSFNPEIAKAQEIKQNSIIRSVVLKESRELAQFLISQEERQVSIKEFLEIQKEIANKYFEWMEN